MSLEREFPPPQATTEPAQVSIHEQISRAFEEGKTPSVTPAGTRIEEPAQAPVGTAPAAENTWARHAAQGPVSNQSQNVGTAPGTVDRIEKGAEAAKEAMMAEGNRSAERAEAAITSAKEMAGQLAAKVGDRASSAKEAATEKAEATITSAKEMASELAAKVGDRASSAKETAAEMAESIASAATGLHVADRLASAGHAAVGAGQVVVEKSQAGVHAVSETVQEAANTVVESAEHAIEAVEEKFEEVAERAHDIAEQEWHEKPSHPAMALVTDVKAVLESVGESIAEAVGFSRGKDETVPEAVGQKIDDLAERLKEHGIDVEHPAGTGPVKKETIGGFVQELTTTTQVRIADKEKPDADQTLPSDPEKLALAHNVPDVVEEKIRREKVHLEENANAFEVLKNETEAP